MMRAAVVVPYSPTDQYRQDAWRYVRAHLVEDYGEPIVGWMFSKAASVNALVRGSDADVLIIHDADSYVDNAVLDEAVRIVLSGRAQWVVPHGMVYRLGKGSTQRWMETGDPATRAICRAVYQGPAGGGIVVLSRQAFDTVNGMDERFTDWGWEDQAWGRALGTLCGPYVRLGADLTHLWHPPAVLDSTPSAAMRAHYQRYKAATFHPRMMRALVTDQAPAPWVQLECPRRFRSAVDGQVIRYGGRVALFRRGELVTTDPDLAEAMACYEWVQEVGPDAEPTTTAEHPSPGVPGRPD